LPKSVRKTFHTQNDGTLLAKYTTCWLAVSEASPDNSCLNFLPQQYDPGYLAGDVPDEDPMLRAFGAGKETFQHIRSVPLPPGGCAFHTHRIIHWGSAAKPRPQSNSSPSPRLAMSCAFSASDFEPPYLTSPGGAGDKSQSGRALISKLDLRLALAGAQVLNYGDRWIEQLSPHLVASCYKLFVAQESRFITTYRAEIAHKMTHLKKEMQKLQKKKCCSTEARCCSCRRAWCCCCGGF